MSGEIILSEGTTGCTYVDRKGNPPCNKVCDAGESMCPHHLLLIQTKAQPKPAVREAPLRSRRTPRGYEA